MLVHYTDIPGPWLIVTGFITVKISIVVRNSYTVYKPQYFSLIFKDFLTKLKQRNSDNYFTHTHTYTMSYNDHNWYYEEILATWMRLIFELIIWQKFINNCLWSWGDALVGKAPATQALIFEYRPHSTSF